ncbi:MAG: Patatin [Candidatus Angelobacter sp.]|nr:Patatin [Candidatus Angelobacter sp.]
MGKTLDKLSRMVRSVTAFKSELTRPRVKKEDVRPRPRPKLGLALGGGFARGVAHIGVLKVFEEEQIPIDYIAGTSSGAVIAAMYSSGICARELAEIAGLLRFNDFARLTISRLGLWTTDPMIGLLTRILKVHTFEELRIPLAVSATEFNTGDSVVFTSGPLIDSLRASCAYPGAFLPVNVNGRLMVDGLLAHPVPTTPLKQMGAEKVVAVYFKSHWVGDSGPRHFMDVIGQCFSIAQSRMCSQWQLNADAILEPQVEAFAYDAFHKASELVKVGEAAARAALPQIQAFLQGTVADPKPRKSAIEPQLTPASVPITG